MTQYLIVSWTKHSSLKLLIEDLPKGWRRMSKQAKLAWLENNTDMPEDDAFGDPEVTDFELDRE